MDRMFRTTSFIIFLWLANSLAISQVISTEQIFLAEGYSVFELGYPLKVAPGKTNQFAYLEYWVGGKQGRRIDNYYLQSYGSRDYVEHWFKPVTDEGFDGMQVVDLQRLSNSLAVIGLQYFSEDRQIHSVARFYSLDGKPQMADPVKLSFYKKRPKRGFRDKSYVSPLRKCMLWTGFTDRTFYALAMDGSGKEIWQKELKIPYLADKYRIEEIKVDDDGNAYFLLTSSIESIPKPPVLLRYNHKQETFQTQIVNVAASGKILYPQMIFLKNYEIAIAGVVAGSGFPGVSNRGKITGEQKPDLWTHVFFHRYGKDEKDKNLLALAASAVSPVPEEWITHYQEKGADFSMADMLVDGDFAVIIYEEHYKNKKKLYFYDLGVLGFDVSTGELVWNQIVQKRQRDANSASFMSYVSGIARGKLRLIYLSERGAGGKLLCTSIDMKTGRKRIKMLASNEASNYLFFPSRSGMVSNYEMVLIGMGNPIQNDYKLITVAF